MRSNVPTLHTLFPAPSQVSPPALFDELYTRFLLGNLHELCLHPSANFVIQAAITAMSTPFLVRPWGHGKEGRIWLLPGEKGGHDS